MSNSSLHVVLGATGGVGHHLVEALENRGHKVRAVSRGGTQIGSKAVEALAADVETSDGALAATTGASVVYMAAQPPYSEWPDRFEAMVENVITGAEEAGAKVVMIDNFYMYGPDVEDIREDSPQNPPGHKGKARKAVAERLLAADAAGRIRVAIGRFSDYYGPDGDNSGTAVTLFQPATKGSTLRWSGHPDRAHTLHYLPDVARAFLVLGENEAADGEIWILPSAPALTGTETVAMINSMVEKPLKWSRPPAAFFTIAGIFSKMIRELKETIYQFEQRYVSHSDKFTDAFGPFEVTPHEDAMRMTLDAYRSDEKASIKA